MQNTKIGRAKGSGCVRASKKKDKAEIRGNYEMLWIFQVSFEKSFRKFWGNFMETLYKIYENLRSIEKVLRKFVINVG